MMVWHGGQSVKPPSSLLKVKRTNMKCWEVLHLICGSFQCSLIQPSPSNTLVGGKLLVLPLASFCQSVFSFETYSQILLLYLFEKLLFLLPCTYLGAVLGPINFWNWEPLYLLVFILIYISVLTSFFNIYMYNITI